MASLPNSKTVTYEEWLRMPQVDDARQRRGAEDAIGVAGDFAPLVFEPIAGRHAGSAGEHPQTLPPCQPNAH